MANKKKLDKENVEDILALTPLQEGMLFHYLTNPDSEQYFEQLSLRIEGKIDNEMVKEAWNFVIKSNEMLRTLFRWEKIEKPLQIVLKDYEVPINFYDLHNEEYSDKEALISKIREEDRNNKINISEEPFRISLYKISEKEYEMIISNHHIIYDGWSNGIILKEFMEAYNNIFDDIQLEKPVKNKYKEYIKWYQGQDKSKQELYWREFLNGFDTKTILPSNNKKQADICHSKNYNCYLSKEVTKEIANVARNNNMTTATILYAAWGIILQRYCNMDDVLFGTTVSGRTSEIRGIENMVGLFINTLPLRITKKSGETIIDLLNNVNITLNERDEYNCTSLVDIKSYSKFNGKESLFDSIVVMENYPLDSSLNNGNEKIAIKKYNMFEMTNFDITVVITELNEGIEIKFCYNESLFELEEIRKMASHFTNVIKEIVDDPFKSLTEIQMLDNDEKESILYGFNNKKTEYPINESICSLFEKQVEKNPNNIALVFENQQMTYEELNNKANQVGWFLKEKGVNKNTVVGFMVERSLEMIVGLLGILKAGGAYLPIDPDYPEQRINYLLESSKTQILLTRDKFKDKIKSVDSEVITVDEIINNTSIMNNNLNTEYDPNQLMYVLYTSGSTGNPKGAMIKSHAFINLLNWFTKEFEIDESSRILLIAPTSFDLAQKNLYSALVKGGRLCLFTPGIFDYNNMSDTIEREKIDIVNCSPSAFYPLIDFNSNSNFKRLISLKKIFFGGEPINIPKLIPYAKSASYNAEFINMYGPTECTDISNVYRIENSNIDSCINVPIGKTIDNVELYVLDKDLNPLPVGVPGELCIGGVSLAYGYYKDEELTKTKFVELNCIHGKRIYKTGDLVKWMPDGNVDFLGRIDYQVKIRGFRIELGEIEACLLQHEALKEVVVIDRKNEAGDKYLCAYIVSEKELKTTEIRSFLSKKLPEYMIPAFYVRMEKLPLTPNGKINRKDLPEPEKAIVSEDEIIKPANEIEKTVLEIWQKILNVKSIGKNDNFFDIGGNSILLIQMHALIEKNYPGKVNVTDLFTYTTVLKLADLIENGKKSKNVDIQFFELPEDYFNRAGVIEEILDFRFNLESEMLKKLKCIGKDEGISIYEVLLSIYIYLLSEMTQSKNINIHSGKEIKKTICQSSFNLESMENFSSLFKDVHEKVTEGESSSSYTFDELNNAVINKGSNSSVLLFYLRTLKESNFNLPDVYDIVFELIEEDSRIKFNCNYDNKRIKKEKVKDLINGYIKLIELIIENYEFRGEDII